MPKKLNIAVIFGGRSGEHEVSLVSASSVIKNLDKKKYNIKPIGITKDSEWVNTPNSLKLLKSGYVDKKYKSKILDLKSRIDVVFPVLHGTYGEDGSIQGLLELADIPYVGCGILGSAVAMDKITQKKICEASNILVPDWIWITKKEWLWMKKNKTIFNKWLAGTAKRLKYPMFIKPSNMGSSVGISKVENKDELIQAINLAAKFDRRIIVEQGIEDAKEIEAAILGNDDPICSVPGEIIASNEFYDYNAKYVDGKSNEVIPAKLSKNQVKQIQKIAIRTFKLLDCAGMARIDFLVAKGKVYLNESNTIPGFTPISMYPKLWKASGISYVKLLDTLIRLARERHRQKRQLKTNFKTKDWYK